MSAEDVEALYRAYRHLLLYIGCRKFGVPEWDAEPLVQESFLALLNASVVIERPRAWLVAAMCNASRAYWRAHAHSGKTERIPPEEQASTSDAECLERELLMRRVLACLPKRDREVLRLHYFERLTAREIALLLETSVRYAEKLISKALRRARGMYVRLNAHGAPLQDRTDQTIFKQTFTLGVTERRKSLPAERSAISKPEEMRLDGHKAAG